MTKENILLQPNEEILSILGYEGLYSITNFGRVWSHEREVKSKNNSVRKCGGMFLQNCFNHAGYPIVRLCCKDISFERKVSRLTAQAFIKNPNNLPEVNHKDGNKLNNFAGTKDKNYEDGNLEWCTDRKNKNHAMIEKLYKYKKHSKFYGVTRCNSKWMVRIWYNHKCRYLGVYLSEIKAAKKYNQFVRDNKLDRPLNSYLGEEL